MANNGYVKGIFIENKDLRGRMRKFEVYCMFKEHPNLSDAKDTCGNCRKQKPKTTIIFSGKSPYKISDDLYKCGISISLVIDNNNGKLVLNQTVQKPNLKSIVPIKPKFEPVFSW
jgi:hypothetical protein